MSGISRGDTGHEEVQLIYLNLINYIFLDSEGRIIWVFSMLLSPLRQFPITFESISLGTKVFHDFFFSSSFFFFLFFFFFFFFFFWFDNYNVKEMKWDNINHELQKPYAFCFDINVFLKMSYFLKNIFWIIISFSLYLIATMKMSIKMFSGIWYAQIFLKTI